jgi:hypothetical protein
MEVHSALSARHHHVLCRRPLRRRDSRASVRWAHVGGGLREVAEAKSELLSFAMVEWFRLLTVLSFVAT